MKSINLPHPTIQIGKYLQSVNTHVMMCTCSYNVPPFRPPVILTSCLPTVVCLCSVRIVECTDLYGCYGNGAFSDPYVNITIQGPLSRSVFIAVT